jgi:iron complex transport system ATP-binding protein
MITLDHLSVGYDGQVLLRDVCLDFPCGCVTVLAAPNGCGKSTLLRTALGLQPPLDGAVLYDGVSIRDLNAKQIALQAAYLAQSRSVPNITGARMVLHGRFPHLGYPRRYSKADHEAVRDALAQMDATALADKLLPAMSGGERQKIYLAMALAQDTETIFLDEPTTYLDIGHQLEVMAVARQLAESGKAVVLVLHDLCLALRSADRLAVFSAGQLRIVDTPAAVYESGLLPEIFGVKIGRVDSTDGPRYYYL